MPEFQVGDIVRVEMPRGYSTRGVLGISLLFSTSPEARFEGAIGTVTEINPIGSHSVHQYLVDFRTHDNSRVGIPWQAQWFREEWLALKERPTATEAEAARTGPEATWPTRPETEAADAGSAAAGIAHPEAKIFTEGRKDFAPPGLDPGTITGTVPPSAYGVASPSATGQVAPNELADEVQQQTSDPNAVMPWSTDALEQTKTEPAADQADQVVVTSTEWVAAASDGETVTVIHGQETVVTPVSDPEAPGDGLSAPARDASGPEKSEAFTGPDRADDRSGADVPTFEPTAESMGAVVDATTPSSAPGSFQDHADSEAAPIVEQGDGFVRVQGMSGCPDGFPIKGNSSSGIYHIPTDASYQRTIPEVCFASEDIAIANGYRAPKGRG
ncbi:MAG TPA: hypothetical protein VEQ36_13625 [Thermomicrobiales bacterium]|nr:hypothetical protein [Thermomicrobiales bacterium]